MCNAASLLTPARAVWQRCPWPPPVHVPELTFRFGTLTTVPVMRVAMFSAKSYDESTFDRANADHAHVIDALDVRLTSRTARLASGADAVCIFVNDIADAEVLAALAEAGVRHVLLRCAGFNNVDLDGARQLGISVARVPAYSPNAVAEHTIALILALNRHIHKAYNRVRDHNFSLEGLVGFDLAGKTAGIVGTGQIGALVARLLWHFRCEVICVDPVANPRMTELGIRYVDFDELWASSDVISLNCPLTAATHHLVNPRTIELIKPGAMLVNTGRGALIDTVAVIDGLKSGQIGSLALDVYEEEAMLFFEDRSGEVIRDDVFTRLLTFPNVLITAHQGFLTSEALRAIAETTIANLDDLAAGRPCANLLT
jgi:D-lactate dehydrogenase